MTIEQYTALAALIFVSLPTFTDASEEDHAAEEHKPLEKGSVWGYSFLFNFLACLPSAFAIIICLWAKLRIADKIITNIMAFASGVSAAS